jgi:hypothetical protein
MEPLVESNQLKKSNAIGWGLIALGFAIPAIAAGFGYGNAFQVGESIPRSAGALLLLGGLSWLITRNRSIRAKSNGRIVVGIMLCVTSLNVARMQVEETNTAKNFLKETLDLQQRQQAKFAALEAKFDKVNLATVLTPEAMTSQTGIAQSRATMREYRTLLAERKGLVQSTMAEVASSIAALPSGSARDSANRGAKDGSQETLAMYESLDTTQWAYSAAIENVINWCEAQRGKLGTSNGQLLFSSTSQQAELQSLLAQLTAAETAFTRAAEAARATQVRLATKAAVTKREAEEMLKR